MSKEILPYPVEIELNTSNINIDSITRDGYKTFWPETKSSADTFLGVDTEGKLKWTTPAGAGNVSSSLGFTGDNYIITTSILNGTKNIKETGISIDYLNNITGSNSINTSNVNIRGSGYLNLCNSNNHQISLNCPQDLNSSYLLKYPHNGSDRLQHLRTTFHDPSQLEFITTYSSTLPQSNRTIFITINGDDINGNGSFDSPYKSLSKAISVANGLSSLENPITIQIEVGNYVENNTIGPLTITTQGIIINGTQIDSIIISPTNLNQPLLNIATDSNISNITLKANGQSNNKGIILSGANNNTVLNYIQVIGFATGVELTGSNALYLLRNITVKNNLLGINVINTTAIIQTSIIEGNLITQTAGVQITGSSAKVFITNGLITTCLTGISVGSNATCNINGLNAVSNNNDVYCYSGAMANLNSMQFSDNNSTEDIAIIATDAGTNVELEGCNLDGYNYSSNLNSGIGIVVKNNAVVHIGSSQLKRFNTGAIDGLNTDQSSTKLIITNAFFNNNTNDIQQKGSSSLITHSSVIALEKLTINNPSNVFLNFTDTNSNLLSVGTANVGNGAIIQSIQGLNNNPQINFKSNLYSTKAFTSQNFTNEPSTLSNISNHNSWLTSITASNTKTSSLRLVSDITVPIDGSESKIRGWDITKNANTNAQLDFNFQNADETGLNLIPLYNLMRLDGVARQLQLPSNSSINFNLDTNLYRSGINTLKTDSNLIIGSLTPNRAIYTDGNNQLISSSTTNVEMSYLSGVSSSVQTQLNNKVSLGGSVMSGALTLPSGTLLNPALNFTGSSTTGLSANSGLLSIIANGIASINIASNGNLQFPLLGTKGILHNDSSGNITSSLILDADIASVAGISNSKLATLTASGLVANSATTATSNNTVSSIVSRDTNGNFSANIINATLNGNVSGASSLNVLKSGDTMSGSLTLLAGNQTPTLNFTDGATTTGITADTMGMYIFANGTKKMQISSNGVNLNSLNIYGIVHTDQNGLLSSSLIDSDDIKTGSIANSSLATVSSSNIPNYLVARDSNGIFETKMITLTGSTINPTDVATKAYVDIAIQLGFNVHTPVVVLGVSNVVSLSGLLNIDGVDLGDQQRVLLIGQTNKIQNGIYNASAGLWNRASDFALGNKAESVYVLISSGNLYKGSAWVCSTPNATIGTNPIDFLQFSLPNNTTGTNVGSGVGHVYKDNTGSTLNFKTLVGNNHVDILDNNNDVQISTDATSLNTISTIVARDSFGNFSAGTISANLTGDVSGSASNNVLKSGDTMTGNLIVPQISFGNYSSNIITSTSSGLVFSTSNNTALTISPSGQINIPYFNLNGIIHVSSNGNLSNGLIVDDDIANNAGISNGKLATLTTAGLVANSATTATNLNTTSAIVARDSSGGFSAGTITANLTGNASGNLLLTGGTLSGNLTLPSGGSTTPSILFSNSTNTGLSAVSNVLNLIANGSNILSVSNSQAKISLLTTGVVHSNLTGVLSSSLIVDSDISSSAGISNGKLATLTTAGLVSNSATTATNLNTASAIVARDSLGGFSAGTITANIIGSLTGTASGNLPTQGGTMTGALTLIAGNTTTPAINFTNSPNAGLSATSGALSFITNNLERMSVSSGGTVSINAFTSSGIVHNNAFGNLTSSLIVDADIASNAGISNSKLATISQIGLVSNSATTATNLNTANAIVSRDSLGGFSAGTITANLTGNVSGSASGNLLLGGGILTGALTLPNGTLLAPSLAFTSSSNTGLASVNSNTLSLITNGVERILISSTGKTTLGDINIKTFNTAGILHNDSSGNITTSAVNLATETTGTLPNSSTTATNINTASAIVARDINGNFSAGTITANLNGSIALQSISMWIGSSFSGTVCLFTANTNKGFTNRNSPSSTNGGFTNWIYTGIYEITFSGSLYNTGSGTFVENIALNGTPVISTTIDDSKGGEDYYTFSISSFVGINSLTDVVSCTTTGLTTSLPNLLHCSIKYLGT